MFFSDFFQVSADVLRVLSATDSEPVVLFCCGAVRFLDLLLASPQQPIEHVLAEDEIIRSEITDF